MLVKANTNFWFQDSIYRTFQETESLLQHLRHGTNEENSTTTEVAGNKMPKVYIKQNQLSLYLY